MDEKLRDRNSDIVYRTKINGRDGFLYILFEHQSRPDFLMVFRLLCYMVNIWKEYLDQHPGAKRLPVIFPAVLYQGKIKWNAPRSFSELFAGNDRVSEYLTDFTYKLYDLGDYQDDIFILGDHMALNVVLYLLKHIFDDDFGDIFSRAMEILAKIKDQSVFPEFLEWALRYTYHARNDGDDEIREYIDRGTEKLGDESVRRTAMTIAERIRNRGLEEGLEKGMEKGLEKGRTMLILKLINKRFGLISPVLDRKLRDSRPDMLDRFGESIFDFESLEDAEKWWEAHGTEHYRLPEK